MEEVMNEYRSGPKRWVLGLTLLLGALPVQAAVQPEMKATLKGHTDRVRSVAFSGDGKLLASGSVDQTVKLWDVATGKEKATLEGHLQAVRSVAFSKDDKLLASGSWDNSIRLWEVASGQLKDKLYGHTGNVS